MFRFTSCAWVVTSPLARARQTAEELLAAWPDPKPGLVVCEHL